jgi:membrane protein implicated in regulation of membrane protease activity
MRWMGEWADGRYVAVLTAGALADAAFNGMGIVLLLGDHPLAAVPFFVISVVVVGLIVRWSARRAERYRRAAGARDGDTSR